MNFFTRIKTGFLRIFSKKEREEYRASKQYDQTEIFNNLKAKEYFITSRGGRKAMKVSYTLVDGKIVEKKEIVKVGPKFGENIAEKEIENSNSPGVSRAEPLNKEEKTSPSSGIPTQRESAGKKKISSPKEDIVMDDLSAIPQDTKIKKKRLKKETSKEEHGESPSM